MKEKSIESFLTETVEAMGGECVKIGTGGLEDRLILLPGGVHGLLELKRPGEEPTPRQMRRISKHIAMGHIAGWAATHAQVAQFLDLLLEEPLTDPAEAFGGH